MSAEETEFDESLSMSYKDIRYTRSIDERTLYAIALGWPSHGKSVTMKSVHRENLAGRELRSIQMIGSDEAIAWKLTGGGLQITFPDQQPCQHAFVFRIELSE